MLSINTNLSSLIAQRSMKQSTNKLNQAIERMTTGAKINHAKDNAANYNIATNMTTKLGALQVAEDNALQGLEMINTTSETLSLIEDKLSRMRALSVQALNGTYGMESLNAINSEANSILEEIVRINNNATFNGIRLFGKSAEVNLEDLNSATPQLNSMGLLEEVERLDTTSMTPLSSVDSTLRISSGTYSISTPEELAKLSEMVNAGLVASGTFVLANDIDLSGYQSGEGWIPIGNSSNKFQGHFNGNGYTISNLFINRPTEDNQAFFGNMSSVGSIKNLRVVNANVIGKNYVGIIAAGYNSTVSPLKNCSVQGTVKGVDRVGGIVGDVYRQMESCYANVQVYGETNVGGLTGWNTCGITNSFVEGYVSGKENVGGCIGRASGTTATISNVYFNGEIEGESQIGGIIGSTGNTITLMNSISKGSVTGKNYIGGIVGYAYSTTNIDNINLSNVSGETHVGGITGRNDHYSVIDGCSSYGEISGDNYLGGLSGSSKTNSKILNSQTYSSVSSGTNVGAIAGDGYTIENCTYKSKDGLAPVSNTNGSLVNVEAMVLGAEMSLQVGVNSSGNSQIGFNTYFELEKLSLIQALPITDEQKIEIIDSLCNEVSLKQTEIGVLQNRLESALDEISTQYENLVSSRSTLQDADIAEVSSEYIRQQILQQASATLLATANQSASIALSLI